MSEIVIDSWAFKNNLDVILSHIKDKKKLGLVLKDNAYGHGLEQIAKLAHAYGIESVFVKNESEALKIAPLFKHVTVFYGNLSHNAPDNICLAINSLHAIESLKENQSIELKINTGMNRNGIPPKDLEFFIKKILNKKLNLFGVFAHNGYSSNQDSHFETIQKNFLCVKEEVTYLSKKLGFQLPRFHSLASCGTLRSSEISDDLVRIGIAAYGYLDNAFPISKADYLKPVASLWADKICEQKLPKGSKIGYGGKGITEEATIISTYDIGYGDGFF